MRRLWGSSRRRVMLIQPAREFLFSPTGKNVIHARCLLVTPRLSPLKLPCATFCDYTPGSLRRAAPMLGVRPPRLCLCGSEAVLRYAPLRRGPAKNLFSVVGRKSLLGGPGRRCLNEDRRHLGNSGPQHPGVGSVGEIVPRGIKVCPVLKRRA